MAIHLRMARTPKEIDDCLWLRHEVFVKEDGRFGGKPLPDGRLVDRFDVFPGVYNVVAYDGVEPIATIRLTRENEFGLPAEKLFNFDSYREAARQLLSKRRHGARPVFGSAGMLAVRKGWRRRRDVVRAMFKVAASVCRSSGTTHIFVAVNHETAAMYRRLGFRPLADKSWSEDIGNYVVPLAATTERFRAWAYGDLPDTPLSPFKDRFERVFVRAGETIFAEGDDGDQAYIIESGDVRITRGGLGGSALTLARLVRGDMFGEIALIDRKPRSATATAVADSELVTLSRDALTDDLTTDQGSMRHLLGLFSERLRSAGELATLLAYAPTRQRLEYALHMARQRTAPERSNGDGPTFVGGPGELALLAGVDEPSARAFLEEAAARGELRYSRRTIQFSG